MRAVKGYTSQQQHVFELAITSPTQAETDGRQADRQADTDRDRKTNLVPTILF